MIQVLDKAIPSGHKSWPPRTLFCLLGLLGGAFIGAGYTFIEAFIERVMQNPDNQRKYRAIFSMKDPLSNID
jgi:uncharacterized protein involved in exopolysaccharide biosynthesis